MHFGIRVLGALLFAASATAGSSQEWKAVASNHPGEPLKACLRNYLGEEAPADSRDNGRASALIARLEDRWLKAIDETDIAALNQILADDFVRPAPAAGQFITKTQLLAYYRSHKQSASSGNKRIENLSITVYGATAIARGMVVSRDTNNRIVSRNLFTDVFVIRNGRWQAVSAQENDVEPHAK